MTTDRELMQQALDYLDAPSSKVWAAGTQYKIIQALRARLANEFDPDWDVMAVMVEEQQRMAKRIEELEAALAQPEQEHSEQWWRHEVSNAYANGYEKGRASVKQPEQEQCHHKFEVDQEAPSHSCCQMCGEVRKQPEQEPVAWMHIQGDHQDPCFRELTEDEISRGWTQEPLYFANAAPQREWQWLTDEEYEAMAEKHVTNYFFDTLKYAHAIEAKLKEKNA